MHSQIDDEISILKFISIVMIMIIMMMMMFTNANVSNLIYLSSLSLINKQQQQE